MANVKAAFICCEIWKLRTKEGFIRRKNCVRFPWVAQGRAMVILGVAVDRSGRFDDIGAGNG
jgi:hypothetical protein